MPDRLVSPPDQPEADAAEALPVSVWATAQQDAKGQRRGRYVPESVNHPAKMLPAIARHAIGHYTAPGELVFDPMCGIGTTLVEAVHLGRDALGVEYEPHWAQVTRANLDLAQRLGAAGHGQVITGDARDLPDLAPTRARGRVALVVTSPPYGPSVHGLVRPEPGRGVTKWAYRYSDRRDPANLAHAGLDALLVSFTRILAGCRPLLRPGGVVVVTARPWRSHGELVDLPSALLAAGEQAGLVPVERCVALLAGLRGSGLVARPSFFQLDTIRKARAAGVPLHLIVHEDVLIFRAPPAVPASAGASASGPGDGPRPLTATAWPTPAVGPVDGWREARAA